MVTFNAAFELSIANNPNLCSRILALKISDVRVEASPDWLQKQLLTVGQRPLNNLVDITNYVMWEIGHPAHVFDFEKLKTGKMVIRTAKKGESITTLDEKTYTLAGDEVVIDDSTGRIIDLPSIIGTANSIVSARTSTALFFIEDILSAKVRYASMMHQIRTQAASLMEKDVDPELGFYSMQRIINLVKSLCPTARIEPLLDIYPDPVKTLPVSVPISQITAMTGVKLSAPRIEKMLIPLGFTISVKNKVLIVVPPSYRAKDIRIPEDIIEEVARIYGYHKLPTSLMSGSLPEKRGPDKQFSWESRIKYLLKDLGFTETYTYSLVEKDSGLKLKNPLSSEWVYLRTALTPSHQKIISENLGKTQEMNFFEIANVYLPKKSRLPEEKLCLILSTTNQDYIRLKGFIEIIFRELGLPFMPDPKIDYHPGFLSWEIDLLPLINSATTTRSYHPISKYAPVIEDINVSHNRPYAEIKKSIFKISPLIKQIELIDKFGEKLTLRLTFHSETKQLSSADLISVREKFTALYLEFQ